MWKRYPAYRRSSVEWLGEIPAHWAVSKLKHLAQFKSGTSITASDIEESGDYPVFGGNGLRGFTSSFTHEGDFALVGRQGALCGCVNYALGRFWASEHAVVASPAPGIETRWLGELLRAMDLNQYSQSAAQPGLAVEVITALSAPVPPSSEQQAIAVFLDRETAEIDALVAKKQALLDRLEEKRAAIISHAVTRGLTPGVPLRDSGIEWLGSIPAHWKIQRAGSVVVKIEQGWSPVADDREADDDEWAVIKLSAVHGGEFMGKEHKALPVDLEADERFEIHNGDFLLTRANTPELVGDVCVVRHPRPRLMLCDLVYRLTLDLGRIAPDFLAWWFLSTPGRFPIRVEARGSSLSMVKVSQGIIRSWPVVVPPLQEQVTIAAYLRTATSELDALCGNVRTAIDRLKEYRAALISAAVTGQIDVREEVA